MFKKPLVVLSVLALTAHLGACKDSADEPLEQEETTQGETAETDETVEETTPAVTFADLPVALCGMTPYDLLDPATLGQVLDFESDPVIDYDAALLGSLLAAGGLQITPDHAVKVHRFRYTTQDRGNQVEATGMIAFPVGDTVGSDPLPLASYAHATTGWSDPCAGGRDFVLQMGLAGMASKGFVAVATDYIGMTSYGEPATIPHAYMIAEPAAISNWDALNAGKNLLQQLSPEIRVSSKTILAGASQGSQTVFFQERMAPYYAPDYDIVGVVGFVPVIDQVRSANRAVEFWSNNNFYNSIMLMSGIEWYGLEVPAQEILSNEAPHNYAENFSELIRPPSSCAYESDFQSEMSVIEKIYNPSHITDVIANGIESMESLNCLTRENSIMYSSIPKLSNTPMMIVYGEEDALIPPQVFEYGFSALCESGHNAEYGQCAAAPHGSVLLWALTRGTGLELSTPQWRATAGQLFDPGCPLLLGQPRGNLHDRKPLIPLRNIGPIHISAFLPSCYKYVSDSSHF